MPADDPRHPQPAADPLFREVVDSLRPPLEQIEHGFTALRVTLDALAEHLGAAPGNGRESDRREASPPPPTPVPQRDAPPPAARPAPPPAVRPAPHPETQATPVPVATATAAGATGGQAAGDWSRILWGDRFDQLPALSSLSGQLLADVYAQTPDAIGLAGQLMTFRTAMGEQKPRMLKDVGEAFYAWKPQGDSALIEPLIAWVHAELEAAELGNRIQVVHPGDRYDIQRHNARQPGVEVADVRGWAVLRDNGKVYSKANVSVR